MKNRKIIIILLILLVLIGMLFIFKDKLINKEYEVKDVVDYKYFVLKDEEKYGVIDTSGNVIIEPKYTDVKIPNPEYDVFFCYENTDSIVLNKDSEKIFKNYEYIEPLRLKNVLGDLTYEKTVFKYSKNNMYGLVGIDGKKITKPVYEEIETLQFKEGEFIVKQNSKFGIINLNGKVMVKCNYDLIEADKYYEADYGYKKSGYIVCKVTSDGYRYGYVNVNGREIIPVKYNDLSRINEVDSKDIYITCAENGKYGLFKNDKKIIKNDYQSIVYNESSNSLIVLKGKKYGVMSLSGEIIIPTEYQQIDTIGENYYIIDFEGKTKVFDFLGKETNIESNLAIYNINNTNYKINVVTNENESVYSIYKENNLITNNKYSYIQYLFDDYFIVRSMEGKFGVIDDTEKSKIPIEKISIQRIDNTHLLQVIDNNEVMQIFTDKFEKVSEMQNAEIKQEDNYIKLYNDKESKYITFEGKVVENKDVLIDNQLVSSSLNNKFGFVDKNNNKIVDFIYDKVTEFNKYGFAGIQLNGKWGVCNSEGIVLVEPKYEIEDEPFFIGQYYKVIYGNGEFYFTK